MAEAYIPGVCNINRAEIAYRRKASYVGLGLFVVIAIALLALGANRWLRLIVFLPLLVGILNALQVRNKFCVSYAASGQQNATEGSKAAEKVAADDHKKDVRKARKMNMQAAFAALVVTIIMVVL